MRAITLTQPFASLVALGAKRVETRGDRFPAPRPGEQFAVHAATGFTGLEGVFEGVRGLPALQRLCALPAFAAALAPIQRRHGDGRLVLDDPAVVDWGRLLPRGAIVAIARCAGVEPTVQVADQVRAGRVTGYGTVGPDEHVFGDYGPRRIAIFLEHVTALLQPVPCSGALGMWEIPGHVFPQVRHELHLAYDHAQAPHGDPEPLELPAVRTPSGFAVAAGAERSRTAASDRSPA